MRARDYATSTLPLTLFSAPSIEVTEIIQRQLLRDLLRDGHRDPVLELIGEFIPWQGQKQRLIRRNR